MHSWGTRPIVGALGLLCFMVPIASAQLETPEGAAASATPIPHADVAPFSAFSVGFGHVEKGPFALVGSAFYLDHYYIGKNEFGGWIVALVTNVGDEPAPAPRFRLQGFEENGYEYGSTWTMDGWGVLVAPGDSIVVQGNVPDNPGVEALSTIQA